MILKPYLLQFLPILSLSLVAGESAVGAVLWSEVSDGDLSGDFTTPKLLTASVGENSISGQIGRTGNLGATNGSDADYLTLAVPEGLEIVSFTVEAFSVSGSGSSGGGSFLAYRQGDRFSGQGFGDIESYVLFGVDVFDILPALGLTTLTEGEHAFWLQETNPTVVEYSLAIQVVPEPSVAGLLLLGSVSLLGFRRRS